jgi:hypothetical protein
MLCSLSCRARHVVRSAATRERSFLTILAGLAAGFGFRHGAGIGGSNASASLRFLASAVANSSAPIIEESITNSPSSSAIGSLPFRADLRMLLGSRPSASAMFSIPRISV